MQNVMDFVRLASLAERILESEADWETKWHCVFQEIRPAVDQTGIHFDWFDPDTTYQDEAQNYVWALCRKAAEYAKILAAVQE